ncbi:MAG TPA: class I SAM-dependent methyltransferase [Vicinamibacterales bacterium]
MTDEEFVRACFERFLRRPAEPEGLAYYVQKLREGADRLDVVQGIVVGDEFLGLLLRQAFGPHVGTPSLSFAPPGHYYSPIPSRDDVARFAAERFAQTPEALVGIDLNVEGQLELLRTLGPLTHDLPFTDDPGGATRYWWDNDGFAPGDATVLAAMLRHFRPRRIIEAGAGYSTAVMLDVSERWLDPRPVIECIDPEPQRLRSLLRGDELNLTVHEAIVQDLPISFFTSLEPNDILFIDSSHVLKLGSDVAFLLLDVLPRLEPGVIIHVHDIATSFEYPLEWYQEGRAWNEAPALRAFLAFNRAFEILQFCDYLNRFQRDAVRRHMPAALRQPRGVPEGNTAVSFWMRRKAE